MGGVGLRGRTRQRCRDSTLVPGCALRGQTSGKCTLKPYTMHHRHMRPPRLPFARRALRASLERAEVFIILLVLNLSDILTNLLNLGTAPHILYLLVELMFQLNDLAALCKQLEGGR